MNMIEIEFTFGEELLEWLKSDIKQKYNIKKPVFLVSNHPETTNNRKKLINWIDERLAPFDRYKWVKYKRINDYAFVLKEYFRVSSDDISWKIVDKFLYNFSKKEEKAYFEISSVIYDQSEARREMFFGIRGGGETLAGGYEIVPDPNPNLNRRIYKIDFQEDEYGRTIPSGYHQLEQK